ncbi:hypothetical protein [Microbaculum marinisediminis]|uniref:Uncharacterized protein n=1 Tax=Microbaculum marinisediminis TaxID=2931392 RepID=A0AAW5QVU2_9HYPH|nr:hypothetical protein [Microbaculum sp. A6E488]MCT8970400.1 hypothetical protein [Microbaculum sp. A6E488]
MSIKSMLVIGVAVLVAAGVAYVLVVPDALDRVGVEMAEETAPAQPAKDSSRITTSTPVPAGQGASDEMPNVGVLDLAALPFESGCGLFLSREGEEDIVFVDAMPGGGSDDANGPMPAVMLIDGTLVTFSRTTADGEPIGFGQYPRQVFDSADNTVRVVVEVDFGEETDPEDVPVSAGEVTVMKAGRPTLKFPVSGGAGC